MIIQFSVGKIPLLDNGNFKEGFARIHKRLFYLPPTFFWVVPHVYFKEVKIINQSKCSSLI